MTRFALALLLAAPLLAQAPRYQEELTVTEVTLDLVVTDRNGNPITGLTAADFEVLEDGKPVSITYFHEVNASRQSSEGGVLPAQDDAIQPGVEPRSAYIFLDNADISRTARTRLFEALETSVVEMMDSGVEVVFFLWTGQLHIIRPHDSATAAEIMDELKRDRTLWRAGAGRDNFRTGTLIFDEPDLGLARQVGRSRALRLFEAFDTAAKIAAKAAGRRILVLASRGFALPNTNPMLAAAELDEIGSETLRDHPFAVALPSTFAPEIMIPTHGQNSKGNSIEDWVAAIANRHGIPIYGMFSGGLDAATRGVTERGPIRSVPLSPSSPFNATRTLAQLSYETGSMMGVAERTGGTAIGASSNFGPFLDQVETDLNHYYTVAYRSSAELRFRKLDVRPDNPAWKVRHREAALPDENLVTR